MDQRFTLEKIDRVADDFWQIVKDSRVFAFHGEMGAGKTTFIHALCIAQNVKSIVGSPTYAIINEYLAGNGSIFHIDLYRLKDEEEALQAGVEDVLYSGNKCMVEWPERAPGIFPEDTVHVFIEVLDETTRRVRIVDK